jgi:integrase
MSVLFNHGLRHELISRNPVQWVRQSAKRKKIPAVLEIKEVRSLLAALALRERTMVLLDVVPGLRASELFGLKWTDVNFEKNEVSVTRSIVMQVVGSCKTEASQKPVPFDRFSRQHSALGALTRSTKPQPIGSLPALTAKAESRIGASHS